MELEIHIEVKPALLLFLIFLTQALSKKIK